MKYVRLITLLGLTCFSFISFAQESYLQINVGYAPLPDVNFGGRVGIEKNLKLKSQFSIGLNYNGYDIKTTGVVISNPDTTYTIPFTLNTTSISLMLNWYPFKIKNQPFSLLFIGLGPAYYENRYSKQVFNAGPGLQLYLGAQYLFFNRLSLGCHIDYVGYIVTNRDPKIVDRLFFTDYMFNVILGYRFKLNPKK